MRKQGNAQDWLSAALAIGSVAVTYAVWDLLRTHTQPVQAPQAVKCVSVLLPLKDWRHIVHSANVIFWGAFVSGWVFGYIHHAAKPLLKQVRAEVRAEVDC
jgi:hypothetical protein